LLPVFATFLYRRDVEPSTVALHLRTVEGARFSDSFATGNFKPLTSVRGQLPRFFATFLHRKSKFAIEFMHSLW